MEKTMNIDIPTNIRKSIGVLLRVVSQALENEGNAKIVDHPLEHIYGENLDSRLFEDEGSFFDAAILFRHAMNQVGVEIPAGFSDHLFNILKFIKDNPWMDATMGMKFNILGL
jgi:hypothetical protein